MFCKDKNKLDEDGEAGDAGRADSRRDRCQFAEEVEKRRGDTYNPPNNNMPTTVNFCGEGSFSFRTSGPGIAR